MGLKINDIEERVEIIWRNNALIWSIVTDRRGRRSLQIRHLSESLQKTEKLKDTGTVFCLLSNKH